MFYLYESKQINKKQNFPGFSVVVEVAVEVVVIGFWVVVETRNPQLNTKISKFLHALIIILR